MFGVLFVEFFTSSFDDWNPAREEPTSWNIVLGLDSVTKILKYLDERGLREQNLKQNLGAFQKKLLASTHIDGSLSPSSQKLETEKEKYDAIIQSLIPSETILRDLHCSVDHDYRSPIHERERE